MARDGSYFFEHAGECPICETEVNFVAENAWFRDHLLCPLCMSIPRERAVMYVLGQYYPNWRALQILELAPCGRGTSVKLQEAPGYRSSHYDPALGAGERSPGGWVNQNAEAMTYPDGLFDLVVTQDVLEHIFDVDAACREIARILTPGGAHIFTTPMVNKTRPTEARAFQDESGSVKFISPPQYHGNPVDPDGSLVTWDFGFDLALRIADVTGMPTIVFSLDRLDLGIRAEYMEVLVSLKRSRSITQDSTAHRLADS